MKSVAGDGRELHLVLQAYTTGRTHSSVNDGVKAFGLSLLLQASVREEY